MMRDTSWDAPEIKALGLSPRARNFLLQEGCRTRGDVTAFLAGPDWLKYATEAPNVGAKTINELQTLKGQ